MMDSASPDAHDEQPLLDLVANGLGMALMVWDRQDRLLFAARAVLGIFPIAPSFIERGTRLRDFLGALYDAGVGVGTQFENTRRRTGREEWISTRLSLHWRERFESVEQLSRRSWINISKRRLSNGIGLVLITDLTSQKLHEEEMQLDRERIELTERILDDLPNAVCVKDRDLNYVAVNKAFCAMHGMAANAILGRSVWDLVDADFAERYELSDREVLETGVLHTNAQQIVMADGEDLWAIVHKFRVGSPADALLVTYFSDVTQVVTGFGIAGEGEGPLGVVPHADVSRFEPGQSLYDPFRALDMTRIVDAPAMGLPGDAGGSYRLRVVLVTPCPAIEQRFFSALTELSCDVGIVASFDQLKALEAALGESGLTPNLLLFDESLGTPPAGLFVGLPQLPVSLAISAEDLAAQIMTVGLSMQTDLDGEFGLGAGAAGTQPAAESPIDVLVAEDNDINQIVFAQILDGLGLSFKIATNGEEAVALWRTHRPKLVLMDLAMPVMSGRPAIRAIRDAEAEEGRAATPIVVVTTQAADMEDSEMETLAIGARLMKPVSPERVEALYHRFVQAEDQAGQAL